MAHGNWAWVCIAEWDCTCKGLRCFRSLGLDWIFKLEKSLVWGKFRLCGVGEAVRVVGQNLLRQKASRQVLEFHAGCCVRPRLLLGHGQLGRTRPTGTVDTDSITQALWEAIYNQF